jgi:hypothetical protein
MANIVGLFSQLLGLNRQPKPKPTANTTTERKVRGAVYRITGILLKTSLSELHTALATQLFDDDDGEDITVDFAESTLCPSCYDSRTQIALVQFTPYSPRKLNRLPDGDTYSVPLLDGVDITIDRDFFGLTQLYCIRPRGAIRAE